MSPIVFDKLLRPRAVPSGGHLRVIAPAGVLLKPELVRQGRAILEARGFRVSLAEGLSADVPRVDPGAPYLAGDDEQRARELMEAFTDPDIDAVICARGGYGAMRVLPLLDAEALRRHAKPLLGFSDITALHGFLAARAGVSSLHGPLLTTLPLHTQGVGEASLEAVCRALQVGDERVSFDGLTQIHGGDARGPLIGGNLSLVASLAGSPWFPPLDGAILFLEEVGEPAYRIDRMLTALRLNGTLSRLSGLVWGDPGVCGDRYVSAADLPGLTLSRLRALTADLGIPVAAGLPVGHGAQNLVLPFGTDAALCCEGGEGGLEVTSALSAPSARG